MLAFEVVAEAVQFSHFCSQILYFSIDETSTGEPGGQQLDFLGKQRHILN